MRDLLDVMVRISKEIPFTEAELHGRLSNLMNSYMYAAPEIRINYWHMCADVLNSYILNPVEEWELKIGQIFNGDI
jgi:hypothetical protein